MKHLALIITLFCSSVAFAELLNPVFPADVCLEGQDLSADDVDISGCPTIGELPEMFDGTEVEGLGNEIRLGAWELGQTAEGEYYKYGSLNSAGESQRVLYYGGGETEVDQLNITCWAKGYYRLRAILQNPPPAYVTLYNHGFQQSFFQFQTDLRNGNTGFQQVTSYMDHLVKWVTVITPDGVCDQTTYDEFEAYAIAELERRGLN